MSPVLIGSIALATFVAGWFVGSRGGGNDMADAVSVILLLSGGEMSAVRIHEEFTALGRDTRLSFVYALVRRLESIGAIASREVPGGPERGGRPRRLYFMPGAREKVARG